MSKKLAIAFFGTPVYSKEILAHLLSMSDVEIKVVVTQEDTPQGRGKHLTAPPVKTLALEHTLPVLQPKRINKAEEEFLNSYKVYGELDLAIVVAFGQIIPKSVLDFPKCGSINIHTSLLPKYRGAAPIQRAIMNGDKKTGVCLMKMDEGLDTGPVYAQSEIVIEENDSYDTVTSKLLIESKLLLTEHLKNISEGILTPVTQATQGESYAKKILNDEAKINFNFSAENVHNHIRGLSSIPGAFTFLEGKRLKIFASKIIDRDSKKVPGEIIFIDAHSVHVACNQGSIALVEVQLEGKKRQGITEFLSGMKLSQGMRLGE